jgi:hypothetical protein
MPPAAPTPITPEGRRAAGKVRAIFAFIAAANIALIGIVVWHNYSAKSDGVRASQRASSMEDLIGQSVAAYNAGDERAFSALFAMSAPSAPARHHAEYRRDFGRILARKGTSQPDTTAGEGGASVHEITCEKEPHARLITKFTREKDAMKIAEWRIEHP